MSGGQYNYAFRGVDEFAYELLKSKDPLRRAFAKHLQLISKTMHDIEWVDSGDNSPGYELDSIRACLAPGAELDMLIDDAKILREALKSAIEIAEKGKK